MANAMMKKRKDPGTRIYGCSDDLIEVDGDVGGEVGCYGTSEDDAVLLAFDDGTMLKVWYGDDGIWRVRPVHKGPLFDRVEICISSEADPYSDVAHLKPGAKLCWSGSKAEKVS